MRIARLHGADVRGTTVLAGVVNRVVRVVGDGTDWVVRFPADRRRPDEFPAETWAISRAAAVGIPSPGVVACGRLDELPYLVLEHVEAAAEPVRRPWCWLGRYAATIATVPVDATAPDSLFSRFGRDLPAAWRQHLEYNIEALGDDDPLAGTVYRPEDAPQLRAELKALRAERFRFGLAHADLAPRNLVSRGADEAPVLIDWGNVTTGPAPWTELHRVHQMAVDGAITPADFCDFAEGVDVDLVTARPLLERLSVLSHLDLVRWARDQRPELTPTYEDAARRGLRRILDTL
nr:aminoglycoside phosphotransferase family protein [Auraticoccus cholistanensis]